MLWCAKGIFLSTIIKKALPKYCLSWLSSILLYLLMSWLPCYSKRHHNFPDACTAHFFRGRAAVEEPRPGASHGLWLLAGGKPQRFLQAFGEWASAFFWGKIASSTWKYHIDGVLKVPCPAVPSSSSPGWVSLFAELCVVLWVELFQLAVPPTQLHLARLVHGVREFPVACRN